MMDNSKEKLGIETSKWFIMLPFISALLGAGALWYAWLRYMEMMNQSGVHWYEWLRPTFMLSMGILCLLATLLFVLGKSSGWSVFMTALSMVPLMLFSNLVILVFRVIQNILQGNAQPFLARLLTEPKNLVIPIVVIAMVLLSSLSQRNKYKTK